jgi:hypothetical protein
VARDVKWRYEELPGLRHGFERAASEAVGIGRDAAPAENAEALLVGGSFDGGFGGATDSDGKKRSLTELLGKLDSLLAALALKNCVGNATSRPAPSPLAPSASTPPRWVRRSRAVRA